MVAADQLPEKVRFLCYVVKGYSSRGVRDSPKCKYFQCVHTLRVIIRNWAPFCAGLCLNSRFASGAGSAVITKPFTEEFRLVYNQFVQKIQIQQVDGFSYLNMSVLNRL